MWRIRHERPNRGAFGTDRLLRPAKLLDPTRDHLLGLRRPAEFRSPCRNYLLGRPAIGLPSQGGCDTNTYCDEVADKASRASLLYRTFYRLEAIVNRPSLGSLGVEVPRKEGLQIFRTMQILYSSRLKARTLKIFNGGMELFLELIVKIRRGHLRVSLLRFSSSLLLAPILRFRPGILLLYLRSQFRYQCVMGPSEPQTQ
jgi:hypothetical protein